MIELQIAIQVREERAYLDRLEKQGVQLDKQGVHLEVRAPSTLGRGSGAAEDVRARRRGAMARASSPWDRRC